MLAPLADSLLGHLRSEPASTLRVLREPTIGPVIPDLLVGEWGADQVPRAYASATRIDAHVWALLEREGPLEPAELQARLHLSSPAFAAATTRLARHGVLETFADPTGCSANRWHVAREARTDGVCLTAVEAKLTRWTDAVDQAAAYLRFADRAYVVLDGNQVRTSAAVLKAVEQAGVGLLLQFGRNLTEVVPAALHAQRPSHDRVVAITKLVTPRGGRAFRMQRGRRVGTPPAPVCAARG